VRVLSGLGKLTIASLVAGLLVAGFLLPYSLGLGLASNKITNALAATPDSSLDLPFPERSTITDNAGKPIAYIFNQNRVVVPDAEISENLKTAIVAVEDRRFNSHKGVDWRGTVRALLSNSSSGAPQGGSTLTQQYVKNYLFLVQATTDAQRSTAIATTPGRKLREAKLALTLEQHKTKEDIRDAYLNLVAFLPSTYGAEAAAQQLFGVSAADLTLTQAALMAALVNNPNKFNPFDPDHAVDALKRRNIVLGLLYSTGSITKAVRDTAVKTGLGLAPNNQVGNGQQIASGCVPPKAATVSSDSRVTNGYFCQYALDYLTNQGLDLNTVANGGYTIKTTLDPIVMAQTHQAVTNKVPASNTRIANVMAVIKPDSSRQVLALTANRPYGLNSDAGQTVQKLPTTFAPLGAGSTFKIFTAAAAMQAGLGTLSVIDTPSVYTSPLSAHPFHNDTDNGETFPPSMTMQRALETSPNTGFVKLEDDLGLAKVVNMAVALGMKGYNLNAGQVDSAFTGSTNTYAQEVVAQKIVSFTLGVTPVSPEELANTGATLADDGLWCPPIPIGTVLDRNDKVVQLKPAATCVQAVTPAIARTLTNAMQGDIDAAGGTANQSAKAASWNMTPGTVAGKTGTTGDYKSSAFLGYTPKYSAATVTWDYLAKPQSICTNPPKAAVNPLGLIGTCTLAQAQSAKGTTTSTIAGMSGGSVPAATWFDAMTKIQPAPLLFPPPDSLAQSGQPNTIVPDLTSGSPTIDAAKNILATSGFKGNFLIDATSTAPINTVTKQLPLPGQSALPGSVITVYTSAGPTSHG